MHLRDRLHEKGWTSAEIEHAVKHLDVAEQKKHPFVHFSDRSVYWILLFAIVLVTLALSTFLFPFLAIVPLRIGLTTAALVGVISGLLFAHVLHDIDSLTHRHHFLALLAAAGAPLALSFSTWQLAVAFALGFCVQYCYLWWKK